LESKALALETYAPKLKLWTPKSPIIHGSVLILTTFMNLEDYSNSLISLKDELMPLKAYAKRMLSRSARAIEREGLSQK